MGKLLGPEAETLLFAAARDDHVHTVIEPALKQGIWVLCDRFSDSTRVYQGSLGKVAPAVLNAMQRVTIGDLKPDLTVILDVPVEVGLAARGRPSRHWRRRQVRGGRHQVSSGTARGLPADRRRRAGAMRFDRCHRRTQYRCGKHMGGTCATASSRPSRQRGEFGMSARQVEPQILGRHPRETTVLFGHREAETALLNAYRSGRIPHAWLIGGAQGIGKATLAYRMARFVLTHRDPLAADVQRAKTLGVDPTDPVARHIAAGAHGGLLTLERTANDKGVMRTVITVDETRETIAFFGSTAAAEGWRVCIVDTVDELNPNAANALLKILEEPPRQSLFLLVSHAPARVLPTILSRCRRLTLRPLSTADVIAAAAHGRRPCDRRSRAVGGCRGGGGKRRARADVARRRRRQASPAHRGAACHPAAGRSARTACAGRCARRQRPGRARDLHRQRRSLGERASARRRTPTPTFRALHGWRRCGKRSAAPRATPQNTISSENRWFSRCLGCLRKQRDKRSAK